MRRWESVSGVAAIAIALFAITLGTVNAQIVTRGQSIAPVFEGWEENPDGSFNLVFGYFNRNWDEEINVPIGPENNLDPGGANQGQPERFYPRRNKFVFRIHVPKDFGTKEIVWTLTTHGQTARAYGHLKPDYMLNKTVIEGNIGGGSGGPDDNKAPVLKVEGEQTRQVKVGTPVILTAVASDDGLPSPRPGLPLAFGGRGAGVPSNATGLRFSWFVYRGAGNVTFDPPQYEAWEDDREAQNSPFSPGWVTPPLPTGNKWIVRATFDEPGTYVLRGLAHDGGLATASDITFVVTR